MLKFSHNGGAKDISNIDWLKKHVRATSYYVPSPTSLQNAYMAALFESFCTKEVGLGIQIGSKVKVETQLGVKVQTIVLNIK